jgi:hypothetical protein
MLNAGLTFALREHLVRVCQASPARCRVATFDDLLHEAAVRQCHEDLMGSLMTVPDFVAYKLCGTCPRRGLPP